jgi:hypothetical protein
VPCPEAEAIQSEATGRSWFASGRAGPFTRGDVGDPECEIKSGTALAWQLSACSDTTGGGRSIGWIRCPRVSTPCRVVEHRLTRDGDRPMPRMSKIELFAAIRRDLAAGMSGRAIEEKHRVGRRTVSAAMASALPPPRKAMPPRGSKLDPFKPAIDEILRTDLDASTYQTGERFRAVDRS